jgi:hypothetical protein
MGASVFELARRSIRYRRTVSRCPERQRCEAFLGVNGLSFHSERQNAAALPVCRKNVRRHSGRSDSKETKAPTGSSRAADTPPPIISEASTVDASKLPSRSLYPSQETANSEVESEEEAPGILFFLARLPSARTTDILSIAARVSSLQAAIPLDPVNHESPATAHCPVLIPRRFCVADSQTPNRMR